MLGTIPDERAWGKEFSIVIVHSESDLRRYVVDRGTYRRNVIR